jgi:hypothetical protein
MTPPVLTAPPVAFMPPVGATPPVLAPPVLAPPVDNGGVPPPGSLVSSELQAKRLSAATPNRKHCVVEIPSL